MRFLLAITIFFAALAWSPTAFASSCRISDRAPGTYLILVTEVTQSITNRSRVAFRFRGSEETQYADSPSGEIHVGEHLLAVAWREDSNCNVIWKLAPPPVAAWLALTMTRFQDHYPRTTSVLIRYGVYTSTVFILVGGLLLTWSLSLSSRLLAATLNGVFAVSACFGIQFWAIASFHIAIFGDVSLLSYYAVRDRTRLKTPAAIVVSIGLFLQVLIYAEQYYGAYYIALAYSTAF